MLKGIARQIAIVLTLVALVPLALEAQESATIRVGARVVSSVIPETQAAAASQIASIAATGLNEMVVVKQTGQTERGYAQVSTESLDAAAAVATDSAPAAADIYRGAELTPLLITVAYTAN